MDEQNQKSKQVKTRQRRSPERIAELVLEAERTGSVAEICRREGIQAPQFYRWKKRFKENGVEGLRHAKRGPKQRQVRVEEYEELKKELGETKEALVRSSIELQLLKKNGI
jgi:transposase